MKVAVVERNSALAQLRYDAVVRRGLVSSTQHSFYLPILFSLGPQQKNHVLTLRYAA